MIVNRQPRSRQSEDNARLVKILLVGDQGTGKSSILERYANDGCYRNYVPTIGIDFRIKRAMISSSWVKLQIWDTAGQRRFQMITSAYYRPSMIIFLVYDVGDHMTFTNTRTYYLPEIRSYAPGDVQIMLVGHKCDIDASARQVSTAEGQAFAEELGVPFKEVSSFENINVTEMFEQATALYLASHPAPSPPSPPAVSSNPTLLNVNSPAPMTNTTNSLPSATDNSLGITLDTEVPDYGFADFRPERFIQELLETPVTSIQEMMERMLLENHQLREKVRQLEQEKERILSIAPIPKDTDSLCLELQNAIATKEDLQQQLDYLEAKESTLHKCSSSDLDELEQALRSALQRVETRRVVLTEKQNSLCVICLSQPKCIVLLSCSHLCLCESCLNHANNTLQQCPVCRKDINGTMKVFV